MKITVQTVNVCQRALLLLFILHLALSGHSHEKPSEPTSNVTTLISPFELLANLTGLTHDQSLAQPLSSSPDKYYDILLVVSSMFPNKTAMAVIGDELRRSFLAASLNNSTMSTTSTASASDWNASIAEAIFYAINESTTTRLPSIRDLEVVEFWPWQVILIVVYTITSVSSILMNFITILVLLKPDSNRSITSELWKFLILLCVSDIGMAVFCTPTTYMEVMKQRWIFPEVLCPVVNFAQICFVFISIYTLVAIGIDRYFAIVHPLYMMHWMRKYRIFIIGLICTVGIFLGSTRWFVSAAVKHNRYGFEIWSCDETWSQQHSRLFTIFIFVSTFALPFVILFFVYTTIFIRVLGHTAPGNPDSERDQQQYKRKMKVLQLLVIIVFLFFVCWCPIHVFQLLVEFKEGFLSPRSHASAALFYTFFFICHFLSMAHSLANPVVYCFLSETFRKNMFRKLSFFWRIKNCFTLTFNNHASENIELNVQGEPHTITSRTRKTPTKQTGNPNIINNNNNNLAGDNLYMNNRYYQNQENNLNRQNQENNHTPNNTPNQQIHSNHTDPQPDMQSQPNGQVEAGPLSNFSSNSPINSQQSASHIVHL